MIFGIAGGNGLEHIIGLWKDIRFRIGEQPEGARQYLKEIRDAIHAALPEAEERISWSMPNFWKGKNIIQFAGAKNYIGLYSANCGLIDVSQQLSEIMCQLPQAEGGQCQAKGTCKADDDCKE